MFISAAILLCASFIQCRPPHTTLWMGSENRNHSQAPITITDNRDNSNRDNNNRNDAASKNNDSAEMFGTTITASSSGSCTGLSCIRYNVGANVLTNSMNIYYIYYGTFTPVQKAIFQNFGNNVGRSPWYNINRKYFYADNATATKKYVSPYVRDDNYSKGKALSGNHIREIIQSHITAGRLPEDVNGVYFVLGASDVAETLAPAISASFCSNYCGYHWYMTSSTGKRLYYSFVGNPSACVNGCVPYENRQNSPNGDVLADAMVSIVAHEFVEAVTDPNLDAWVDGYGEENADKCSWNYGTKFYSNGYYYNTQMGNYKFLIQQNWNPSTQKCALSA